MKRKFSKKAKEPIILLLKTIPATLCLVIILSTAGYGKTETYTSFSNKTGLSGNEAYALNTAEDKTNPDNPDEPDEPNSENPSKEEDPPKEKPSKKGSFENPYNAKKTISISYEDYDYFPSEDKHAKGDFKITLKGTLKGTKAYKFLKAFDESNAKPKKGYQWLVLKYEIKYKKGSIKKDFDASYLINPYNNFFSCKQKKITSFSKYKPSLGNREYTHNIMRAKISQNETKTLWTAIMVKDDWFPVYYRICTDYTEKEGHKTPVYEWFKIP